MRYRVHWVEERHMTAEVDIEPVTEERAEAWLLAGHPKPRDRAEVAEAQEFMLEQDALMAATMPDVPVSMVLVDQSVMTVTEVPDEPA